MIWSRFRKADIRESADPEDVNAEDSLQHIEPSNNVAPITLTFRTFRVLVTSATVASQKHR
jgi:hypothetical protein